MAYKLPFPSGRPRARTFYMPYSLNAYVLIIEASVHGLWVNVLDFLEINEAILRLTIFKKGIIDKNTQINLS
jgi:hypothetical protein